MEYCDSFLWVNRYCTSIVWYYNTRHDFLSFIVDTYFLLIFTLSMEELILLPQFLSGAVLAVLYICMRVFQQ